MSDVNKQLLEAAKALADEAFNSMGGGRRYLINEADKAIAAAEQAQQITDSTRVAWTSLGTVKAMLPELLASDDVKVRENAQIIDALVKLVGCQQQAEPVARIKTVGGYPDDSRHELELLVKHGQLSDGQLLYAAQPPAVAVPDGYALVPVEPTEEMFIDGMEADCMGRPSIDDETHVRGIWRAMISAAQKGGAA